MSGTLSILKPNALSDLQQQAYLVCFLAPVMKSCAKLLYAGWA
jgi:hypothetical protein